MQKTVPLVCYAQPALYIHCPVGYNWIMKTESTMKTIDQHGLTDEDLQHGVDALRGVIMIMFVVAGVAAALPILFGI